jgi:hypothetical protein
MRAEDRPERHRGRVGRKPGRGSLQERGEIGRIAGQPAGHAGPVAVAAAGGPAAAGKAAPALVEEGQEAEEHPLLEPEREQLAAGVVEGVAGGVDWRNRGDRQARGGHGNLLAGGRRQSIPPDKPGVVLPGLFIQ